MVCSICNHENPKDDPELVHLPNQCKKCNCGQSEIVHRTDSAHHEPDYHNNVHLWAEKLSHKIRPQTRTRQGGGY